MLLSHAKVQSKSSSIEDLDIGVLRSQQDESFAHSLASACHIMFQLLCNQQGGHCRFWMVAQKAILAPDMPLLTAAHLRCHWPRFLAIPWHLSPCISHLQDLPSVAGSFLQPRSSPPSFQASSFWDQFLSRTLFPAPKDFVFLTILVYIQKYNRWSTSSSVILSYVSLLIRGIHDVPLFSV